MGDCRKMLGSRLEEAAEYLSAARILPDVVSSSFPTLRGRYLPCVSQVPEGTRDTEATIASKRVINLDFGGCWGLCGQTH